MALKLASRNTVKHLILWDVQDKELFKVSKEITEIHSDLVVSTAVIDLSKKDLVYKAASKCIQDLGGNAPDIIINNAGIIAGGQSLLDMDDNRTTLELQVNVMAHIWVTKAFLPAMQQRKSGHFVNVSSMTAVSAYA